MSTIVIEVALGNSSAVSDRVNVRDYGATGDGGTDDAAAITLAIAAASGRTLYFPAGTYVVYSALIVGGGYPGGLTIEGDGWDSTIKVGDGANCYAFDFNNVYTPGLTIRDLRIDCNGANQTSGGGGIYARGAVHCLFDHLQIDTPYEAGIRFYQDGTGSYGHHTRVTNCLIWNGKNAGATGAGYGILSQQNDELTVTGCTFQDNGHTTGSTHYRDTGAGLSTIQGCAFVNGGSGSSFINSDSNPGRLSIIGNQFDSTVGNTDGVRLSGSNHMIVGNTFIGIGNGASADCAALTVWTGGCTVSNNTFTSSGAHAIGIKEIGAATDSATITSNTFEGTFVSKITKVGTRTILANNTGVHDAPNDAKMFYPIDYGALIDGSTDDSVAFQAAITAASVVGGTVFWVGTARVTRLYAISNVTIKGAGPGASVLKLTDAAATGDWVLRASAASVTAADSVMFRDFAVDGNKAHWGANDNSTYYGLYLGANAGLITNLTCNNVVVHDCLTYGFDVLRATGTTLVDCVAYSNGYSTGTGTHHNADGFSMFADDVTAINCTSYSNGNHGFSIGASGGPFDRQKCTDCFSYSNGGNGFNVQSATALAELSGCDARSNTLSGFYLSSVSLCSVNGCTSDANLTYGFRISGGTKNTISGCVSRNNNIGNTANIAEFNLDSTATGNVITGCVATPTLAAYALREGNTVDIGNVYIANQFFAGVTGIQRLFSNPGPETVDSQSTSAAVTAAYTFVTCGASDRTMTLPTAVGLSGQRRTLLKVDSAGAGKVIVATTSSQTILGNGLSGTSRTSPASAVASITVVSDNANWLIVAKDGTWT
jgi:hypothetical protein